MTENKVKFDLSDRSNMFYWQVDRNIAPAEIKQIFLDRAHRFDRELTTQAVEYGMQQAGWSKEKAIVVTLNDPIPFGYVNNVSRAELKDGTQIVVRVHPPEIINGYYWSESLAAEKARSIGLPAYRTYFIDDTRKKFPFDYMLMERMKGEILESLWPLEKELEANLAREMGRMSAQIHTIGTKNYGFFDNKTAKLKRKLVGIHSSLDKFLLAAFDDNLNYLSGVKALTVVQRKKIEKIVMKNIDLAKVKKPVLIHNDYVDWNMLSDGKSITGILDWDECFSGDPVMEIASWSLFFDNERLSFFLKGYEEISKLPADFEKKFHLYRLRYLVAKSAIRNKMAQIEKTEHMSMLIERAKQAMEEEFKYFGI
jgi:aminoglycoside phosphotransferase (APT) family kinase protein